MNRTGRIASLVWAFALMTTAGCGDANEIAKDEAQIRSVREVGELYRMASMERKKPPTKPDDFRPFQDVAPMSYYAVVNGDVVVVWGAKLADLTPDESKEDSADEVLAYERKVPEEGGIVLMKNRTARRMTLDEFRAAPKAAAR